MTALILDGFNNYGTGAGAITNMLAGPYAAITTSAGNMYTGSPSWALPRAYDPLSLIWSGINPSGARLPLPASGTHFFVAFRVATDSLIPGACFPVVFMDNNANGLFTLNIASTGAVQLVNGNPNQLLNQPPNGTYTVIAQTTGPVVTAQAFHYFEMEVNTVANTFTLRVDDGAGTGTPAISATDARITGTIAQLNLLAFNVPGGTGSPMYMRDLFIRDANGTINNGFLGDRQIATLFANADTTTMGWTPNYYQELGAGILNLTSSNACISTASATSLNIGSGDFTEEVFVRFQALPTGSNKAVIFSRWDETANQRSHQLFYGGPSLNNSSLCFQSSTDGTNATVLQPIVYPWSPQLDTWYHIAIVRSSGNLLLFVNGQQLGLPIADARTYFAGSAPWALGGQVESAGGAIANTEVQGWLDEVRFTVGFARYTSNFTPTTTEFPRGVGDANWTQVQVLAGFDNSISDESSAARTFTARNGAAQQTVVDGSAIGKYSTLGTTKITPDDNTFMNAPFLYATDILTLNANPSNGNTVTVGTKDGTTAAVYTFKTTLASAFDVLIDSNVQNTLQNLYNAINAGAGAGTKYGTGTTSNFNVSASQLPAGQMQVTALVAGTGGNSIAATSSGISGGWATATLQGGVNIPGASNFKVQRPPPNTTLISAAQVTYRAFKSDAGICTMNSGFVGPLGGVLTDSAHGLTINPTYYRDIYEHDPDTGNAITPTTVINGAIEINRVT